MATAVSTNTNSTEIFVLWSKPISQNIQASSAIFFEHIAALINHVCNHIATINKLVLVVSGDALKKLINDRIHDFPQIEIIYAYYDNNYDLEEDKSVYQTKCPKIRFIHERNVETQLVETLMVGHAINRLRPIECEVINSVASSIEQRIGAKRSNTNSCHSPEPKRLSIMPTYDYTIKNIEQISSTCVVSTNNDQHRIRLGQIQEMIYSLLNRLNTVIKDQQQIHNSIRHIHTLLQTLAHNYYSLQASYETNAALAQGLDMNYVFICQELWSIQRSLDDALHTSHCVDAESERQTSIYSPPFYTSPTGYKMCLRLYLNGDSDTRNTHISLFLVIMRSDYDAILHWPFSYEVSFCLIDQSTLNNNNQRNITVAFWPDIRSTCFHRPVNNMNDGYGKKEFLSLVEFEQNKNLYVRDNTMFIEANINFLSERPVLSSISHAGESPNDEKHIDTISEDFMNAS
ncbi:unnamed protein product [Rotaria sp. Silwood1]|nr:unnamed protein product [Rotaria sp. Silwood1]